MGNHLTRVASQRNLYPPGTRTVRNRLKSAVPAFFYCLEAAGPKVASRWMEWQILEYSIWDSQLWSWQSETEKFTFMAIITIFFGCLWFFGFFICSTITDLLSSIFFTLGLLLWSYVSFKGLLICMRNPLSNPLVLPNFTPEPMK